MKSGYDDMVEKLRHINKKAAISESDFEFAKTLFHTPLSDRLSWLYNIIYEKMMQKGKIGDLEELNNILDNFEEVLFP